MDRAEARIPRLGRGTILASGILLSGCSLLHIGPAPMKPMPAMAVAPPAAPLPEPVQSPPEPPPPQMASIEPPRVQPPPPRPIPPAMPPLPKPAEPPQPVPDMNTLIGADFNAILNVFRSPDTVQKNALYIVWVYSPPGCTLQLFFYPDIQTTEFHLLKYDLKSTDMAMPTAPQCVQRILVPKPRGAAP